jgi:hypothetical protein
LRWKGRGGKEAVVVEKGDGGMGIKEQARREGTGGIVNERVRDEYRLIEKAGINIMRNYRRCMEMSWVIRMLGNTVWE